MSGNAFSSLNPSSPVSGLQRSSNVDSVIIGEFYLCDKEMESRWWKVDD